MYIGSNLSSINNTVLLDNYMVPNMKWKECNPTNLFRKKIKFKSWFTVGMYTYQALLNLYSGYGRQFYKFNYCSGAQKSPQREKQ